jgi:hypothetical protein
MTYSGPDASIKAEVARFPLLFNMNGKIGDLSSV